MAIAGRVAIVPKGDWSADATYKRLDAVTYNNTLYFAKKEVPVGTATSNTEYWSKSIVGGASAIATTEDAGIVKPADGLSIAEDGTLKVSIDGTTLTMDQVNNVIKLADALKDKIGTALQPESIANNQTTTEAGFALDARQANPNVEGTLAKQVSELFDNLKGKVDTIPKLNPNQELGEAYYGKPYLVIKELFSEIPTGKVLVFTLAAAQQWLVVGIKNNNKFASFLIMSYYSDMYHVYLLDSKWYMATLKYDTTEF